MADKKKMSVEDILAACRTDKPGGENVAPSTGAESSGEAAPAEQAPADPVTPAADDAPPAKKPGEMSVAEMLAAARGKGSKPSGEKKPKVEKPAAPAKKPGEMSVADMLAAARAGKSGGAAEKSTSPKPAAKSAPAAKEKPAAAEKSAKPVPAGPLDTQSILSSARKKDKAGPITKAEAAAKGKTPPEKPEKKKVTMPERPAYVAPTPKPKATAKKEDTRRGFFAWAFGSSLAIGFSTLTLTGLISSLGMARFMFPNVRTEPPMKFKAGTPADLSPGQVETKYKSQFAVWVVRAEYEGQPQIYALSTVCTHLGCTPNWLEAEQKFKCPCHGSGFYKDGVNFEGPAPRPLERYAIRIADDGQLEIDKSRVYQQELGQWADPGSFIGPA
ncbi:Rieske 2Fe-2S domain-containing protein [Blastopirellula sp. J2-11]|uniref:QcrA and Rieske domain-containing protein n=1 Tax=Blastopirellula sp. J2-11 TaxID=2943192 RepID=UPI0021CA829B|nr:Rieske 2Fe-2S domain-containing protein [Blastopirellula sp. J2-11]UUO08043.1 Rieske 2Fe-2S domain-containing protein [Blastopirellula sp. J2-11]